MRPGPRSVCFLVSPLTRLLSHRFPSCPSLAASEPTPSESRALLRSPPSSRRRRSPTSSAPPREAFALCQRPLTRPYSLTVSILPLAHSLADNEIGVEGASALAAVLNETKITNLKCAPAPEGLAFLSAPIDMTTLSPFSCPSLAVWAATTSPTTAKTCQACSSSRKSFRRQRSRALSAPPPKCSLLCQRPLTPSLLPPQNGNTFLHSLSEHIPFLGPFPNTLLPWSLSKHIPSALARKRTRPFPIPIHTMLPYTVRRVDRGHVLLRDGWVARAPAPISPPCDLPASQLTVQ